MTVRLQYMVTDAYQNLVAFLFCFCFQKTSFYGISLVLGTAKHTDQSVFMFVNPHFLSKMHCRICIKIHEHSSLICPKKRLKNQTFI